MSLHVASYDRDPLPMDLLVTEPEVGLSRDTVTVKGGVDERKLLVGTVLAAFTSGGDTGKYLELTPAAADGTQIAARLVIANTVVPAATDTQVQTIRCLAKVRDGGLIFVNAVDATQRAAAVAALASHHIYTA